MSIRMAVIDGTGLVENVILAAAGFALQGRTLRPLADAEAVSAGWTWSEATGFVAPAPAGPRMVDGAGFLSLFTPAEVAALWTADARLMAGALKVAAQNACNLGSQECADLLNLAVGLGALAAERVPQILAGQSPA